MSQRIENHNQLDPRVDRAISDLVGSLTDPIICHKGQEEKPPEWLRNAITLERLVMNLAAQKGETPTGTDAEAAWYLSTASLEFPSMNNGPNLLLCLYPSYGDGEPRESATTCRMISK